MQDFDAPPPITPCLAAYVPRSARTYERLIAPVFAWLQTSRQRDKLHTAEIEVGLRFRRLEEEILEHFSEFAGGPDFIPKHEAWKLACRQREFVREACARMAEGLDGAPTNLSEEIRAMDIGEHVRVVPDYSRKPA